MIEINKEKKTVYIIGENSAQDVISAIMKAGGLHWKEWSISDEDYFYEESLSEMYDVPNILLSQFDLFNHISEQ
jgi:hypothetical protein